MGKLPVVVLVSVVMNALPAVAQSVDVGAQWRDEDLEVSIHINDFPHDQFQEALSEGSEGLVGYEIRILRRRESRLLAPFRNTLLEREWLHRIHYDQFTRQVVVRTDGSEASFETTKEALESVLKEMLVVSCDEIDCRFPVTVRARSVIDPSRPPGGWGVFGVLFRNRYTTGWAEAEP